VQDLLKDQADRVRVLIEQGAIVYVCGDGGRMEPDVKRALVAIHGEAGVAKLAVDNPLRARRVGRQLSLASNRDAERARDLRRIKLAATALLVFTAALFLVARTTSRRTGPGVTSRRSPRRRPWAGLPTGTPWSPCSAAARLPIPAHGDHPAQSPAHRRHLGRIHRERISSRPTGREATG